MVVFICNACGDSLKKQQVEKHLQQICRRGQMVSCVDCSKDFTMQSYKDHIKCVTEDEKYSGKNYQPKVNKGQVKQEQWTQRVQEALGNTGGDRQLGAVLERMLTYDNIPRKKAKFENFMRNSFRSMVNPSMIERIWNIVESQAKPPVPQTNGSVENPKEDPQHNNDVEESEPSPAKKKKVAEEPEEKEVKPEVSEEIPKFKVNDFIIELLTEKSSGISFDKLLKRIIKGSNDTSRFRPSKKMASFDEIKLEKVLAKLSDVGKLSYEKDKPIVLATLS